MTERILIVDEDDGLRESLERVLAGAGYEVLAAGSGEAALQRLAELPIDVVLCDLGMPGLDGFELIPQLSRHLGGTAVVLMAEPGTLDLAAEAQRLGAYDYLAKPLDPSEVVLTLRRAYEREQLRTENARLRRDVQRAVGDRPIVAASKGMIELLETLERAAALRTDALVTGEHGTGKEALARAIHAQSPRRSQPFIAVTCPTENAARLERELFGTAERTSAGAPRPQRGLVAQAHGGTLFLDEIGELPDDIQERLLLLLEEEELGSGGGAPDAPPIDVRLLASTSVDLEVAISDGRFSKNLYTRLNEMRLHVPALRDRREDIPLLADDFLRHARRSLGKNVRTITDEALERLSNYDWPGNVRELENVIERAVILADTDRVSLRELPQGIVAAIREDRPVGNSFSLRRARRASEAATIRRALVATNGNRTHAAKLLEISHRALLYKIKEFGLRN